MKIFNKILSVVMSGVLLFTSSNALYAADLAFNQQEISGLMSDIERVTEQDIKDSEAPYGDKVPTLKEIDRKAVEAVNKVKRSSREVKKWIQEHADNFHEDEDVALDGSKFYERIEEYLEQHKDELSEYSDKEKRQIAFYTVFYDEVDKLPADIIEDCDGKNCTILYIITGILALPLVYGFMVGIMSFLEEAWGLAIGFGCLAILTLAWYLFTGSTTTYFSSAIHDCEGKKFGEPCDIIPEQVKKEFLANPFGAIEHFVTKSNESSVIYNLDLEGATMLNDAVDIVYYMPFFSEESYYKKVKMRDLKKMLYTKTMYWRQMSPKEQKNYLHRLGNKARRRYEED